MVHRASVIGALIIVGVWLTSCAVVSPSPTMIPATKTLLASPTATRTSVNMASLNEQLSRAAESGDVPTVRRLLQEGADINSRDAQGRTPIMLATRANRVEVVRVLIQLGADINLRDNQLDNPFLYAGAEGLLDVLKLVIDAKPDTKLTNRFGGTALIPAAERGHVAVVNELLTRTDVNVNHINNLGWTALLEAIVLSNGDEKHHQVIKLLIAHGADVNIPDKQGVTPLQHARARGFKDIERTLIDARAR